MAKYIPIGDYKSKLLAKWVFDNQSTAYVNGTTVYDLSGKDNNLVASNITYVDDVDLGRCAYFNGSAHFNTASTPSWGKGKKSIRIKFKTSKISTKTDYCFLIAMSNGVDIGWDLNCYGGNLSYVYRGASSSIGSLVPQDTKAHDVLMTYDPASQITMFNNVLDTPDYSAPATTLVETLFNSPLYIGSASNGGAAMLGYIQSIEIYNDVITFKDVEKTKISDMQVGECIPCRYTALTSGQVGIFSELGTCTTPEIPVTGTATPDGKFYLIMTGYDSQGRKKLVADRNIQTGISWDTLNSAGLCSEIQLTDYYVDILPVLTSNTTPSPYVVSASNERTTDYKAFQAFDKSSRGWACNGVPDGTSWIKIDLGSIQQIDQYKLNPNAFNCSYPIRSWKLQISNDGITWTDVHIISIQNSNQLYDIPSTICRYLKWIPLKAETGATYHSIREITLYIKKILTTNNSNISIRLPTGGISAIDRDNEWDKIIVESNLGGTITPGDNNVWNAYNSRARSWTSTTGSASTARIIRGGLTAISGDTIASWNQDNSANNTSRGFRPVMLVEDTSAPVVTVVTRFMLQQGTNIFDINPANYSTPPTNISELHVVEPLTDTIIEQSGGGWDDVVNYLSLFKGTKYKILKFVRNE